MNTIAQLLYVCTSLLTWGNVLGDDHLVTDHPESPITTARALVSVVVGGERRCRHVRRVASPPTLVNVGTRGGELLAVVLKAYDWVVC